MSANHQPKPEPLIRQPSIQEVMQFAPPLGSGIFSWNPFLGAPAPTVTGIFPPFGSSAGGTAVTVSGTNFTAGGGLTSITIGGVSITGLMVTGPTTATGTTAAATVANADVVAFGPGGHGTLHQGFTYMPATLWTCALYGEAGTTISMGNITQWNDQSGAGNHFYQTGTVPATNPPAWNANGLGTGRGALTPSATAWLSSTTPLSAFVAPTTTNFTIYAVVAATAASAGAPELYDGIFGDSGSWVTFGVTSSGGNSGVIDVYDGTTGDQVVTTAGGLSFVNTQLIVASFNSVADEETISINSGSTYSQTGGSFPSGAIGYLLDSQQIGISQGGVGGFFQGQIGFILVCAGDMPGAFPAEDLVIRTFAKNYYLISNW